MINEIETKVLNIDFEKVNNRLKELGAECLQSTRLKVDWFRPVKVDQSNWFLRIRSDSDGRNEVTLKTISKTNTIARECKEVSFFTEDVEKLKDLFVGIGLESYAHQDKDRTSWRYKGWRFDIDQYPNVPAFIEVEGESEDHVKKGIELLGLEGNKTWNDGERTLIQKEYGLNWFDMRYD